MAEAKVAEKTEKTNRKKTPKQPQSSSSKIPTLKVEVSNPSKEPGTRFTSSVLIFREVGEELMKQDRELFIVLHLDGRNRLLAKETIAIGTLNTSLVHPREVFKGAVLNGSAAIICVHNHPSGDPAPSQEDKEITVRLQDAAHLMGIRMLDHIIIGRDRYISFVDLGIMPSGGISESTVSSGSKKRECECKSRLLDVGDRLYDLKAKVDFVTCMDWDQLNGATLAQIGHGNILREVRDELKRIEEELGEIRERDE